MTPVFLDTGYIIALEAVDDQNHQLAREHWSSFTTDLPKVVTTSFVFGETVTFFNHRRRHAKAEEIGRRLLKSPSIDLVHVDEGLLSDAWSYFVKHSDKTYSLTDCISFVLMNRLSIRQALAFDQHFTQAGFQRLPG